MLSGTLLIIEALVQIGFKNEFYKTYASVLKDDLMAFFNDFFHQRADLSGINWAHIALLPKVEVPLDITHYRPISLVHNIIKLLTKVLAIRLQRLISLLIHCMQSGFIKGRAIVENFALSSVTVVQCAQKSAQALISGRRLTALIGLYSQLIAIEGFWR